jgi:hypothetical protein
MASGDVVGRLLFETGRNRTAEIGHQRTPSGKDAALDALLQARHLAGDFGQAPRRA